MRLKAEREKEIRDIHTNQYGNELVKELLAEIDALRGELHDLQERSHKCHNEQFDRIIQYGSERDALRAENEKLKTNQVFEASCTHLFEENQKLKAALAQDLRNNDEMGCEFTYVNALKEENQKLKAENELLSHAASVHADENRKLRERIEKLREAHEKIVDPRKRDHLENEPYASIGCMMNISDLALAQDDAEEKRG